MIQRAAVIAALALPSAVAILSAQTVPKEIGRQIREAIARCREAWVARITTDAAIAPLVFRATIRTTALRHEGDSTAQVVRTLPPRTVLNVGPCNGPTPGWCRASTRPASGQVVTSGWILSADVESLAAARERVRRTVVSRRVVLFTDANKRGRHAATTSWATPSLPGTIDKKVSSIVIEGNYW